MAAITGSTSFQTFFSGSDLMLNLPPAELLLQGVNTAEINSVEVALKSGKIDQDLLNQSLILANSLCKQTPVQAIYEKYFTIMRLLLQAGAEI